MEPEFICGPYPCSSGRDEWCVYREKDGSYAYSDTTDAFTHLNRIPMSPETVAVLLRTYGIGLSMYKRVFPNAAMAV